MLFSKRFVDIAIALNKYIVFTTLGIRRYKQSCMSAEL
jgi:hypothetical protein